MKEQEIIRERQMKIFNAFMKRALRIVDGKDDKSGTLGDACRLVETALKAAQRDASAEAAKPDEAADEYVMDLGRVYGGQGQEESRAE